MGSNISYLRPDGQNVPAYLAEPEDDAPGVVVIQEWWGVTDHIKSIVDRLAEAGYRALSPDLYRGRTTRKAEEANAWMNSLDWQAAVHQDLQGAVNFFKNSGKKVAVLGFCMGGALALATAVHAAPLDATVCFYGIPPLGLADPAKIQGPLLCHFAQQDDWCTPSAVEALEQTLKTAGVSFELHRYAAQHAFFNDKRPEVFDPQAANLAWSRTLEFLGKNLGK